MKIRGYVALAAMGVAVSWLALNSAEASPFGPGSPVARGKQKASSAAGKTKKAIRLAPRGLAWGMGNEQVARAYDKHFDAIYGEKLKKTPLGPQTQALDAELEDRKDLIRRNLLAFGAQKTGVDSTPLKGEYSYRNNESMSRTSLHGGLTRNFFYFNDSLWKVYDEHALRKGGALGPDYASAIEALTEALGAAPKKVEPDYDRGINFEEARWTDGTTLMRAVNREHQQIVGVVYVDESVQSKLPTLRKNRLREERVDRTVSEATTKAPPPDPKKKKKKGR